MMTLRLRSGFLITNIMVTLGIETSCDETAAAVLTNKRGGVQILSNIVASSASIQSKYGGIIPEQAAREQLKSIIPVIEASLQQAHCKPEDLDAIAVTQGPGLIGSLLVGVETAKVLAKVWDKPLIPINHLIGHFYANWIEHNTPIFPCIGLLVSGGHTDLVLFADHRKYKYLGGTRDDAAGECFDKCARLLGLPYPGGPQISKLAEKGNPKAFNFPRPMLDSNDLDFSFSGLKTAFMKELGNTAPGSSNLPPQEGRVVPSSVFDLAASLEAAIVETLVTKTVAAAQKYKVEQIIIAGGVAANRKLKADLGARSKELGIKLHVPPPSLCTDNGAMIAAAAFFTGGRANPLELQANPNLSLAY